ncbi:MAG: DUF4827 domain-containing protein [Bacteroidaceae bacterium]|nr:DUF4827 domain-containing protein [Bacteroidaceae bacterium]
MNKLLYIVSLVAVAFCSCNDDVTYAELRANERKQISSFLSHGCCVLDSMNNDTLLYVAPITRISEAEFKERGYTCDLAQNEYVYLKDLEVYMQIVRRGTGDMGRDSILIVDGAETRVPVRGDTIAQGTTRNIYVRYKEFNIAGDSIQTSNLLSDLHEQDFDLMTVTRQADTFTGTFVSGIMKSRYGSTSVPNGWLYPLYYICLGRNVYPDSELAKVRLIVPSTEGQSEAYEMTYPCFYELTYMSAK